MWGSVSALILDPGYVQNYLGVEYLWYNTHTYITWKLTKEETACTYLLLVLHQGLQVLDHAVLEVVHAVGLEAADLTANHLGQLLKVLLPLLHLVFPLCKTHTHTPVGQVCAHIIIMTV